MRTSILGTFFLASPSEIEEGANWYQHANIICRKIASDHEIATSIVAAVVAALSPQNPWERNVLDAANLIEAYINLGADAAESIKVGTFGANKRKALAILELKNNFTSPDITEILKGLKVINFFWSILQNHSAVCVDGHAYSIWLGERVSTSDTPKITPKLYNQILTDYQHSTVKINEILETDYSPAQIQAITWVVHRNIYGGKRKSRTK